MKHAGIVVLGLVWFALGWILATTTNANSDYRWLASPIAIISSASITLTIAVLGWQKSKKVEATERTIAYILSHFPLSRAVSCKLGDAQRKLMEVTSSFAVKTLDKARVEFHLDIYEDTQKKLSEEEVSALSHVAGVFETIFVNIKSGYFDERIVKNHLGPDLGVEFWIRSWPFVIYNNEIHSMYMRAKGFDQSDGDGIYSAIIERMVSDSSLEQKYPLYGEKAASRASWEDTDPVVTLRESRNER